MRPARVLPVVFCLALATCVVRGAAWQPPRTTGWIEARTERFTLYSNAPPAKSRRIAVQLERFRQALGRMTRGLELEVRVPTTTVVFRNDAAYTPYKLDDDGRPLNVSGYFLPGRFRNYLTLDASAGSRPMRVVYHEYFHAVMDATLGSLPQWFNEGLAEYYSTFRARPGSTRVEVGHPIEAHLRFLATNGTIPWDDVFRTTTESRTYNEGTRQGAFYAQSWLLVHYLGATDERAQAAGRFLTLLREGNEPDAALEEALGMDAATLIAEVESYRTTGSSYVWWDLGQAHAKVDVTIREIEPAEVLYRLGDLLAHRGQLVAARKHLEGARTGDWSVAQLSTSLGFAALVEADTPRAAARFESAIEAGAADAEPYVRLAEILIERFVREAGNNMARGTPTAIVDARELLGAALEREPESFPALIALARTYLFDGDTTTGVAALARGKALRPLDLEMLELEACLLARGGEVERAWALVQHAIVPKNGRLGRRAAACVADGVTTAAREFLEADNRPAALLALETAMETISDSEIRSRLEPLHSAVVGGERIVFVDHETPKVDEFRKLMETVRSLPPEEALVKVEEFLVRCQARRMCGAAEKTADELRELIAQSREAGLDPAR